MPNLFPHENQMLHQRAVDKAVSAIAPSRASLMSDRNPLPQRNVNNPILVFIVQCCTGNHNQVFNYPAYLLWSEALKCQVRSDLQKDDLQDESALSEGYW